MVELEFVRTCDAPRQLVWDAWTDPDQMAQWWGPRGISTPRESIKLDLRPGGRIAFDMVDDATGARYPNSGTILEVEPPARLVWSDDGFADGHGKGTTTVTFAEVDAETTTLTLQLFADFSEPVRAGAEQGWGTQLDKLVDYSRPCRPDPDFRALEFSAILPGIDRHLDRQPSHQGGFMESALLDG